MGVVEIVSIEVGGIRSFFRTHLRIGVGSWYSLIRDHPFGCTIIEFYLGSIVARTTFTLTVVKMFATVPNEERRMQIGTLKFIGGHTVSVRTWGPRSSFRTDQRDHRPRKQRCAYSAASVMSKLIKEWRSASQREPTSLTHLPGPGGGQHEVEVWCLLERINSAFLIECAIDRAPANSRRRNLHRK